MVNLLKLIWQEEIVPRQWRPLGAHAQGGTLIAERDLNLVYKFRKIFADF